MPRITHNCKYCNMQNEVDVDTNRMTTHGLIPGIAPELHQNLSSFLKERPRPRRGTKVELVVECQIGVIKKKNKTTGDLDCIIEPIRIKHYQHPT